MKKLFIAIAVFAGCSSLSYGKSVDEANAKTAGYNFYVNAGGAIKESDLQLAYKATSDINGKTVTDFYIFNAISSTGFVIVSGDDNVLPVLAYSTESAFYIDNVPSDVKYWLEGYKNNIAQVIQKNTTATPGVAEQWNALLQAKPKQAAKVTSSSVSPLLTTIWDQSYYYNRLCPTDTTHHQNALTGCVATAMAQCMKYWNWPVTGSGSHSYMDATFGLQQADFGATTYNWAAMHNAVTQAHNAVDTIMYHAGVSVDMAYGLNESGSYVLSAISPVTNCAEYALTTYFRYAPTVHGVQRNNYNTSQWVNLLEAELTAHRPVIYSGYGPQGGHCWMCDGYNANNYFHFNWGWSGAYNGYYTVDSLQPGGDSFNNGQGALVGIMPDSSNVAAPLNIQQPGVTALNDVKVFPNPAKDLINISAQGEKINEIRIIDVAGRKVTQQPGNNASLITVPVNNLSSGIYMLQIQTSTGILTRKIVIGK